VLADEWIPLEPGTEGAFARQILKSLQGAHTSALAGELAANGPSLVIGDAPEIPEINRLLGAWGTTVVAAAEAPVPESWRKSAAAITALADVPDHSIRVLLIDESAAASYIPWHQIEPKLSHENSLVVTFAATRGGYARHAQYALPVAVYPELTDDIPPAVDSTRPVFRISVPLVTRPQAWRIRRISSARSLEYLPPTSSANAPTLSTKRASVRYSPTPTAKRLR
jgi:hypothetical protein